MQQSGVWLKNDDGLVCKVARRDLMGHDQNVLDEASLILSSIWFVGIFVCIIARISLWPMQLSLFNRKKHKYIFRQNTLKFQTMVLVREGLGFFHSFVGL